MHRAAAWGPGPATASATVVVPALASTASAVKLNVCNASEKFLKKGQRAFGLVAKPNGKNEISGPVALAPGAWAGALTHDTNDNDRLDKNFLGIPTKPCAFSNNVGPKLSAPNFEECKFMVDGDSKFLIIKLMP